MSSTRTGGSWSVAGPGGRGRKRKGAGKSAEFVTTDEEAGEASEVEGLMANGDAEKPASRARQNGAVSDGEAGGATEDEQEAPAAATTPKARPKPRPVRNRASPKKPRTESPSKSPSRSPSPTPAREYSKSLTPLSSARDSVPPEEPEEPEDPEESQALATPKASRKRGRSDDDEPEDEEMPDTTTNGVDHDDAPGSPSAAGASQETQASEIKIRRKRVRH